MAGTYFGVAGVARKVTNEYFGVNGVARKVKNGFIGVNGVARTFFSSAVSPLYLFKRGTGFDSSTASGMTVTLDNTYGELDWSALDSDIYILSLPSPHDYNNPRIAVVRFNATYDLSDYKYIKADVKTNYGYHRIGIGITTNDNMQSNTGFTKSVLSTNPSSYSTGVEETITLDVSSINGNYYIYLFLTDNSYTGSNYTTYRNYIYNVWLTDS